jgi:galactose mutarotase-like enzyme
MDYQIENENLSVKIKSKGAELFSIVNKQTQLEYMWGADPKFWAKSSPVLFPIVGTLKENTYHYQNKSYSLSRHGFARDQEFKLEDQQKDSATFLLISSPASKEKYPFDFELRIKYELKNSSLYTHYQVKNSGMAEMYFSLGAHPAFKVPLSNVLNYEDYYLEFNKSEDLKRWPITKQGLIDDTPQPLFTNANQLALTRELFANDALVFKQLNSTSVSLKSNKDRHGLTFSFKEFPFLGIWAQPGADFVCIEPWCGIADSVNHSQELTVKEGIEKLSQGNSWFRTWQATFW